MNTGSIDPAGGFAAIRADAMETYTGTLAPDGSGTGVNTYTSDGCTSVWDVMFSPR